MTTFFVNGSTKEYVTPRYSRLQLKAGQVIKGPAIIDQMDATTVITPNYSGVIDKFGDIIISKKEGYSVSKSN